MTKQDNDIPGGLGSAHRGYLYQDVVTAYFFARGLYDSATGITVDRKEYKGDIFDDLTVQIGNRCTRRQFKSSADADREFACEDLKTKTSSLRIDDVVHSYLGAQDDPADEYRICATWTDPGEGSELFGYVERVDGPSSFDGYATKLYRLRADVIWPEGGEFQWKLRSPKPFDRDSFLDLASRLFIELECPQISLRLNAPGPLEQLLFGFLSESIGIGRYPNDRVRVEDFASKLIIQATRERVRQGTVDPQKLFAALGLQTDYGRVPQKFPVVSSHMVPRDDFIDLLESAVLGEQRIVLTGPPGSGKSWLLTDFAERLRAKGHLVARHYCYLEPADRHHERRITSNVLFGNLIAEVLDVAPELKSQQHSLYSAGPGEFIELLGHAVEEYADKRVVIIVDGLDHIARILNEAETVATEEARIIEELSILDIPPGVCLLLSSQPGTHLQSLDDFGDPREIPIMQTPEIDSLAEHLGVFRSLESAGFGGNRQAFTSLLEEKSEGNPLYATYLCRHVLSVLLEGEAVTPTEVLNSAPPLAGDLGNYYAYLMGDDGPTFVARQLALMTFAVTEADLVTMVPPQTQPDIGPMLARLSPVLTRVHAQGGLRVYHESFRRFIVEHEGFTPEARLAVIRSIVDWLGNRDFYADARAYQFLLPYLRQLGDDEAIIEYVGTDFIARSLGAGHTEEAIYRNLDTAVLVAADKQHWSALVRFAEIHRAIGTCFQEKLLDFGLYGKAFAAVHGWATLADRLVFDGRPTWPRNQGLLLCSLIDDAGAAAPWDQYKLLPGVHPLRDDDQCARV